MYKYAITGDGNTQARTDIMQAMDVVRAWKAAPETITALTNGLLHGGPVEVTAGGITIVRSIVPSPNDSSIAAVLKAMSLGETRGAGPLHAQVNHYRGVDSLYAVHTFTLGRTEVLRYSETAGALVLNLRDYHHDSTVASVANRAMLHYMPTWHAELTDYDGLGIWCAGVYYQMFERRTAFVVLSNGRILVN